MEKLIPDNLENAYITQLLHICSCLTAESARDTLPHFSALTHIATEQIETLSTQIAKQNANLGHLARKTDFTQKQAANNIESITLALASLKAHIQADA